MIHDVPMIDSGQYSGRILIGSYSRRLKNRLAEYIRLYRSYEASGSPAVLYIAAWRENEREVWYEFVCRKFVALMGCRPEAVADTFRRAIIERRIYRCTGTTSAVMKEVEGRENLSSAWQTLREESKNSGEIEAVYKLAVDDRIPLWLKDQAVIEPFDEDGVFLSRGCLTIVSNEMEAEDELQRHRDDLEAMVRARTSAMSRLNGQLMREIMDRKRAEIKLQQTVDQLARSLDETINVISSTVEVRDPYTAGHQQRVTEIAVAVAQEMGLPEEQVKGLQMAGRIHDIGKISIPSEILCKPGRLNQAEIQLIRRHPDVGYDILRKIDFPWPVALAVQQHHEKMNGSGYPRGLSGGDILMEARILSVADVVESISSHRPYRPGLGIETALEEIAEHRSVLYDPDAVDACLRIFREKGFGERLFASQNPVWPFDAVGSTGA